MLNVDFSSYTMESQEIEPDAVDPDEYLERVLGRVVRDLMNELKNLSEQEVSELLERITGQRVISDDYKMKSTSSPERELVNLMCRHMVTVRLLQRKLEECRLYNVLRVLNTKVPAKILTPAEDTICHLPLDKGVRLEVKVCGSPFPYIQWYFNGSPLVGETSPILWLKRFSIRNEGEYICKVKQKLNGVVSEFVSHKYILYVQDTPPRITVDLKDVEMKAQKDLVLSFQVTGYPEPTCFCWFKNGKQYSQTEIPQLRIVSADSNNSGEYYCEASSRAGVCATRTAVVKIQDPMICPEIPEIIKQPKANQVYFAGDTVHLTCEVLCCEKVEFRCFLNDVKDVTGNCKVSIKKSSLVELRCCELKYDLVKEQMEKENWKPLHFKFVVISPNGQVLSDDVKVEVRTTDVKTTLTARNKWALLIGNSHYENQEHLPCAWKDIRIMKKNLEKLRFRVMMFSDLSRTAIQNAVKHFSEFVQKGDYVTFFYAGHGLHNDGKDYIIPVDAMLRNVSRKQNVYPEQEIKDISIYDCLPHLWIVNVLQNHEPALMLSIYDTCRRMKPHSEECQSSSLQHRYLHQTALKNSYSIFATSENYAANEDDDIQSSLLVATLQDLMTYKISVKELASKVLENFRCISEEGVPPQVPKVEGDLALPLSLTDPSQPQDIDTSECGVLKKWEEMASGRGRKQAFIALADTKVEASIYWNIEPRKGGVTWTISNCLELIVDFSQDASSGIPQGIEVQIRLWNGLKKMGVLRGCLSVPFLVHHLEGLEVCLPVELSFAYKGILYKKEMNVESPAISQKFYKGNYMD